MDDHDTPDPTTPPLGNDAFQARAALDDALERLTRLSEPAIVRVLADGPLERLLQAIAPLHQDDRREGELLYDYLLRHKDGLTLLAQVRRAITHNYSLAGDVGGERVYVSPDTQQWFEDGVMFLQGEERFGGLIGLYREGKISFGIAARDTLKGEALGPNDFVYVELEEYRRLANERFHTQTEIDTAASELRSLLRDSVKDESQYQAYLERHPWILGAQYTGVQSHARFDDRNIPDFSGVRIRDGSRDILEIKSPALSLFRADGEFSADFSNAWHQVERYLDFARRNSDYLFRERGLRFENPHCYLIAGQGLTQEQLSKVRGKERMNPAVTFLTYDDLQTLVDGTVAMIKRLKADAIRAEA